MAQNPQVAQMTKYAGIMPTQEATPHIVAIVVFNGVVLGDFASPVSCLLVYNLKEGATPMLSRYAA